MTFAAGFDVSVVVQHEIEFVLGLFKVQSLVNLMYISDNKNQKKLDYYLETIILVYGVKDLSTVFHHELYGIS